MREYFISLRLWSLAREKVVFFSMLRLDSRRVLMTSCELFNLERAARQTSPTKKRQTVTVNDRYEFARTQEQLT